MADVAVITGGGAGLGRALGERCARLGMAVALLDIDGAQAEAAAAALAADHGIEAIGRRVDVASTAEVEAAAAAVDERFGKADLVIANVGVQRLGSIDEINEDEWRWLMDVNVLGGVRTTKAFLPLLRRSDRKRLAFTISASFITPGARMAPYQTSKFALLGLAETLHLELAGEGIGVSAVFPSGMMTNQLHNSVAAQPAGLPGTFGSDDDFLAMHESNPLLSEGVHTPEDAAAGVVEALLAGERYVVTHGDLRAPLEERTIALRAAAEAALARTR